MVGLKSPWLSQHWALGVVLPSFLWTADQCSMTSKRQVEHQECLGKKKENYNTEHFHGIPFLWVLRRREKNNQRYKIISSGGNSPGWNQLEECHERWKKNKKLLVFFIKWWPEMLLISHHWCLSIRYQSHPFLYHLRYCKMVVVLS